MKKTVQKHPWLILVAGAAIQILTGIPSAWGVFQKPLMEEYAFSEAEAGFAFSILIAAFGIGCVLGGFLQDKRGPRTAALCGTALLCAGFVSAAFFPRRAIWMFYAGFSLPVGLGCAFLYPSIQSCAQKWYAQRKGLATGVIGGAVGLSGAFLTFFVRRAVAGFGIVQGIRGAFWSLGALMLPVCLVGSLLLENPPLNTAQMPQNNVQRQRTEKDYTPCQMLHTPQYWLCTAAVCFSTPAVLLFSPIIVRLGTERGLDENTALYAVVLGSVGSAAGRLLMPMVSDRIGRRTTDLGLFATSLGLSIGFAFAQGWMVIAVYAGLTFCYSALAAVLPAFSTDLFGLPHAGVNYGFLALGQSVGSLTFPILANVLDLQQGRHWLAAFGAVLGFVAIWKIVPTKEEDKAKKREKNGRAKKMWKK
jgi:OFA family oxalate/formate antiporter-like MFS transporter